MIFRGERSLEKDVLPKRNINKIRGAQQTTHVPTAEFIVMIFTNMRASRALFAALSLSVCCAGAFPQTAAALTAAQASAPPTTQPAQAAADTSDEALTKAVHAALDADPHHFFRHVDVRVDNGVATLSGFVHSSQAINRARTIAGKVPGVTRVVTNDLSLQPNRPR